MTYQLVFSKVAALPAAAVKMLNEIQEQCNMVPLLVMVGEDPELPGNLLTMVLQGGETASGLTFKQAHKEFKSHVEVPFNTWVTKVVCELLKLKLLCKTCKLIWTHVIVVKKYFDKL